MKFLIKFVVEEPAVGPTLAALNSHEGVVFDHLAIEPLPEFKALPKPDAKPSQRKKSHRLPVKAREHVLRALASRTLTTAQIAVMLKGYGFSGAGPTLRNLKNDGLIEKVGGLHGMWRLKTEEKEKHD